MLLLVHLIIFAVYFSSLSTNNYKSYPTFNISVVHLHDSSISYFEMRKGQNCFISGADSNSEKCKCQSQWFGSDCGIPVSVWQTPGLNLTQRTTPKRLILIILLNKSIEVLSAHLKDLKDTANIFVIGEVVPVNSSSELVQLLLNNWMEEIQDQILYEELDPAYPASSLISKTLLRISDVRPDDLIMLIHSEEFPSSHVLRCLQLYDGFPDPLGLYYRSILHGYKDLPVKNDTRAIIPSVFSITYLLQKCHIDSQCFLHESLPTKSIIGSSIHPAGWRCISCDSYNNTKQNTSFPPTLFERLEDEQPLNISR